MYDRMCHIKVCNLLGFLTLIDLKKIDLVSLSFVYKVLHLFVFGKNLNIWIESFKHQP